MIERFANYEEHRLLGVGLMIAAVIMFAGIDTTTKYLLGFFPFYLVLWLRFAGQLTSHCGIAFVLGERSFWKTNCLGLQLLRSTLLFLATMMNFWALSYLPLSITVSILFTYPLIVAAFAPLVLNERLPASRWLYLVLAFGGVLIIMRPGTIAFTWPMLISFACTFVVAAYAITTRLVARRDRSITSAFYSGLVGTAIPVWLFGAGEWQLPDTVLPWVMLFAVGAIFASLGHGLFGAAHRHAPAPVLAPYIYTQIIWVSVASYLVFGDLPDGWTITGCLIIIAANLRYLHIEWQTVRKSANNNANFKIAS